jgi:hypothetical protein
MGGHGDRHDIIHAGLLIVALIIALIRNRMWLTTLYNKNKKTKERVAYYLLKI